MERQSIKKEAQRLRRLGKTYSEIQKMIGQKIPKSTLSYWCKDIFPSVGYYKKIQSLNIANLDKARKIACLVNRDKREKFLKSLRDRNLYLIEKIDKDIQKIALATLYFGEGAKWKGTRYLGLGNSNPDVIKLYLKLLRNCYAIDRSKLKCRIGHRADQDINELQKFWSRITKIPLRNFYKTKPDPRTIGKKTKKKDYKGVCVIYYFSTEIQLELEIIADLILTEGR